jgi:uncharacterized protein YigA (DUF484 family)
MREAILACPQDVLDDRDMMRALIATNERRMGTNIVDLRGMAMDRLEARLDRLEDTHRSVIAAAYDNLAGTHTIHRAVLRLLEAETLGDLLVGLSDEVAEVLRVDAIRLILEIDGEPLAAADGAGVLFTVEAGFIDAYLSLDGTTRQRDVTLRPAPSAAAQLYGTAHPRIGSEACIKLDCRTEGVSALLVLGAQDRNQFSPHQGTDLLTFLGGVIERLLHRWLP